jgi:phospholipase C
VPPLPGAAAGVLENGLANGYYEYLLTGGTGQPGGVPDARINYNGHDASHLPPGPYQLTSSTYPYDAYAASPVHRFYQMWQQLDCDAAAATQFNGWGCVSDLFPWVEVTIGAGSNGKASRRASPMRRPAKVRPQWASITSSTATRRTSRCSPTLIR